MVDVLDQLIAIARFRLGAMTSLDLIDLLLVTVVYYGLLTLLRRSQAAVLLRGVLALMLILITITLLLPLPTLDWLMTGLVIALLISVPITLQPELRRWLEGLGHSRLFARRERELAGHLAPPLREVIRHCSEKGMGALIVLEGQDRLDEVIATGVRIDARLSSELLNTIFFDKTPLHDGAVVLREDTVVAASCVLPLTQQTLPSYRRLGTRHRAGVGLSEVCDALVIIVSEETGHLSLARGGKLQSRQDVERLRQVLASFYSATTKREKPRVHRTLRTFVAGLGRTLLYVASALFLAALTWGTTMERTNPTAELTLSDVPLRVGGLPGGMAIISDLAETASVTVRTTTEIADTLTADSFQAAVDVDPSQTKLVRLPVSVTTGVEDVEVLAVSPSEIDIDIVPVITRTFSVDVYITEQDVLSDTYELTTAPEVTPGEVVVRGPHPYVDEVRTVQAEVSVADAAQSTQRTITLKALDEDGAEVSGITIEPSQVQVTVSVERREDVHEAAVNVVTTGTPPDGYWLSAIQVEPATVTLLGEPDVLDALTGYVDTLPVDIGEAYGTLDTSIPLDVPSDIQVLDASGASVQQVQVSLEVAALQGDLALTLPIEIQGGEGMTVTLSADTVDVLISGDLPTLWEIEADPSLVRVTVDVAVLPAGNSADVTPIVMLPEGVEAQLVHSAIAITKEVAADTDDVPVATEDVPVATEDVP